MSRISLTEAYNNRDVIAWLTRQQSSIDEIRAFCQFLIDNLPDPNEFVLTIGDVTISGTKTFLESIVAQDGMDLTGLLKVTGTLQVDGDIVQNGSAYDTHAEQLYTTKDNVIMRDGAVSALSAGDTSGFVIKKYDGSNDMNLGVDANGVARLGDSGNELPFLLRDEAADLVDGAPLVWDAANLKAISGSGGGGGLDWTLRTPNDDWSDLFDVNGTKVTSKKNIIMSNQSSICFIPKGYGTKSIAPLYVPYDDYNPYASNGNTSSFNIGMYWFIRNTYVGSGSSTIERQGLTYYLNIDFDNKTAQFNRQVYNNDHVSKSSFDIYTAD